MPIVAVKDMLEHAYAHDYAISAFDLLSLEALQGIMAAAERCRSPVILNLPETQRGCFDFELLMPALETAARRCSQPVAIHQQHGIDIDSTIRAINSGCNSVMLDNSQENFENNIRRTCEVVKLAHACGVPVEGELDSAYRVDEMQHYVAQSGVDFLAISSNTVHADSKGELEPDADRLRQINKTLKIPLAIYGGADLSEDQCLQFIAHGVAKINHGTALYDTIDSQIRNNADGHQLGYSKLMTGVSDAVSIEAEACMRLGRSEGRGAALLAHCTPWSPVEHLIIYNVTDSSEQLVEAMLSEGRKALATIPGVREVITARAVKNDAKYLYTWLIRFCHPAVIDSYREHPVHVAFADRLFRPIARDRISIDYQWDDPKSAMLSVTETPD